MSEQLPPIQVDAEGEERTWRVTLETDATKSQFEWSLVFHREIIYRDAQGNIVLHLRGNEVDRDKFPTYKTTRRATVVDAETVDPGIVPRIRNDIDIMIAQQKAAEAAQ